MVPRPGITIVVESSSSVSSDWVSVGAGDEDKPADCCLAERVTIYVEIQEIVPAGPDRSPSRMVVGLVLALLGLVCNDLNKGLINIFC